MHRLLASFVLVAGVFMLLVACGGGPQLGEFLATPVEELPENTGEEEGSGATPTVEQRPYDTVLSLYHYVAPDDEPDEIVDGKPIYYVYLWLPEAVPEVGVRAISPVRNVIEPTLNDVTTPAWEWGQDDYDTFFDPYITFERSKIYRKGELGEALGESEQVTWRRIASNDDSEEVLAQPTGEYHNALLRVTERRELTVGLVRIGITDYKNEEVAGTFLVQVGIIPPENVERPKRPMLARSQQELYEKLQATTPEN